VGAWLRDRLRSLAALMNRRPGVVLVTLVILALAVRQSWLGTGPLVSGDWGWATQGKLAEYFPWPRIWNDTLGIGGENAVENAFRFPVYVVAGMLAHLGANWAIVERVVYFIPYAVVLPVAGWLLSREILGKTSFVLLTPLLLVGNTYFLMVGNTEVPLAFSAAIGILALFTYIKAMKTGRVWWGIATGLLLAVATAYDIRPVYITILMIVAYYLVLCVSNTSLRAIIGRLGISALAGGVYLVLELYWILPVVTSHGKLPLPLASAPDFNIITLSHSITSVFTAWTGSLPAAFHEAGLSPILYLVPLIAVIVLVRKRLSPELVWLTLMVVVFAFLGKTNNPPFGGVYDWLFVHVPGFNLFREGSKFYYPVAMGFSILVPASIGALWDWSKRSFGARGLLGRGFAVASAVTVMAISLWPIYVLQTGVLLSTTTPTAEPASFRELTTMITSDHHRSQVLWFGSPIFRTYEQSHHYSIASSLHPLEELNGNVSTSPVVQSDPFQEYCPVEFEAYCYVNRTEFPYLTQAVDAGFLVSPAGVNVGSLSVGISPSLLESRIQAIFGPPRKLGSGATALYVWRLHPHVGPVTTYPGVLVSNSGPWSLAETMPAVDALHVPIVFRQTYNGSQEPAVNGILQNSVGVVPGFGDEYHVSGVASASLMAKSSAHSLVVTVNGVRKTYSMLTTTVASGWSLYGPVTLSPQSTISATSNGQRVQLGPVVAWNSVTRDLLAAPVVTHGSPTVRFASNGERIVAGVPGTTPPGSWVLLANQYDPGWQLTKASHSIPGDGLLNLFHVTGQESHHGRLSFTYASLPFENLGRDISVLGLVVGAVALGIAYRRKIILHWTGEECRDFESRVGSWFGWLSLCFLGFTALGGVSLWFGLPSLISQFPIIDNPYGLTTIFASMAILLIGLSMAIRIVGKGLTPLTSKIHLHWRTGSRLWGAVIASLALLLSSCGIAGSANSANSASAAFSAAQRAGASSELIVTSTVEQAQLAYVAKDPVACIADYTIALRTFSTDVSAYLGRARCYRSPGVGDFHAAADDYRRALELAPEDAQIPIALANTYIGEGYVAQASAAYASITSIPDAKPSDYGTAVKGLIAIHELDQAHRVFRVMEKVFPNDPLTYVTGYALANASDQPQIAAAMLIRAQTTARALGSRTNIVQVYSVLCDHDLLELNDVAALNACRLGSDLGVSSSGALANLAVAEANLGHLRQALTDFGLAVNAFQASVGAFAQPSGVEGFGIAHLLQEQAWIEVELHNYPAARGLFQRAIKLTPKNSVNFAAALKADLKTLQHE